MTLKRSSWLYKYLTFGPFGVFNDALVGGGFFRAGRFVPFTLTLCGLFWRLVFTTVGYLVGLCLIGSIIATVIITKGVVLVPVLIFCALFVAAIWIAEFFKRRADQKQKNLALIGAAARSAWKNTVCPIVRIEDWE